MGSDFTVEGKIESQYKMEPYALELPNPTASRCTADSFNPDKQYFQLSTSTASQPTWWYDDDGLGAMNITIRSFASGHDLNCRGFSSKLNPNQTNYDPDFWFDCTTTADIAPIVSWKANYNPDTNILSVGVTWRCDELNPGNPYVFPLKQAFTRVGPF